MGSMHKKETKEKSIFKNGKRNLEPFPELTSRNIFLRRSMEKSYTCALKIYKNKMSITLKAENSLILVSVDVM